MASPEPTRRGWTPASVDRPVATWMTVAAVVVFGWVSLAQMPIDLMPEMTHPSITVRTVYTGAAPEEIEDAITDPIEEFLGTVEGLVGISSMSRAGSSDVVLEFGWDTNLDAAIQKVRERIVNIDFPDGADAPLILRYDPTLDPMLELAVTGEGMSAAELRHYVEEEVERELEELGGVAMVRVIGGDESIVRVALDEGRLRTLGIAPETVAERLRSENVNVAGGRLYEGELEYLVRTVNEFSDVDDIRTIIVAATDTGIVRLSDIADVDLDVREQTVVTRVGGTPSVEVEVYKDADANLVTVAERVRERVFGQAGGAPGAESLVEGSGAPSEEGSGDASPFARADALADNAPDGIDFVLMTDQSTYVRAAIDEVTRTAMLGGLCAVLVLFIFLRQPFATFVIGLAIPLSVVATFAPLRLLGVSLNIMSLGGIALGIGMLVDNAIVVLESIVRCGEEGDDPRSAAIRGTREVAGAVVASTMTTVAVFLPIVFVDGVAGQLFADLGIAVVLSLSASLLFALFFVPMMATLPARLGTERRAPASMLRGLFAWTARETWRNDRAAMRAWAARGGLRRLAWVPATLYVHARFALASALEFFARALAVAVVAALAAAATVSGGLARAAGWALGFPLRGFATVLAALTSAYRVLLTGALRARVWVVLGSVAAMAWAMTTYQQLGAQLIPELRQGVFTVELSMPIGTRLEETVAISERIEARLHDAPTIARVAMFAGRDEEDLDASDRGEHTVDLTVVVAPSRRPEEAEAQALAAVRRAVAPEPAASYEVSRPTLFAIDAPVVVEVRGHELDALHRAADTVEGVVRTTPGVTDVRSTARDGFPEVRVTFDRDRLAALGLDVRAVAETIRSKVRGDAPTSLRAGDRQIEIEVAVRDADVTGLEDLRELVVAFVPAPADAPELGPAPVRLSGVADVAMGRGPAEIRHVDGQRAALITAGTSVLDLGATVSALDARLARTPLEPGMVALVAGQSEELEQARRSLGFALALAVFLVYVAMASNFESLLGPLVILVTIPLALVGVVAAMRAAQTPVSVVTLIGVIVLAGIVVNNAIVLVDYILTLRRRGMALRAAIVEACALRLRPVLITATTTVLGLLPMALGLGEGAEIRRPLAWVVISGLSVGTVLTLVVIPVVYHLTAPLGARFAADEEPG